MNITDSNVRGEQNETRSILATATAYNYMYIGQPVGA